MLANGTLLQNRYLIKRPLAQGGMGTVYEAEAIHLGHAQVAVKETFFTQEWLREQFKREASMLARLRHNALPKVSDHFVEDTGQFLVMEFIPGDDLDGLLSEKLKNENKPFDWRLVMQWADRLLDALEYIHGQQPPIIHRDIKPQNLKLTPSGDLFLIDFGLAKDATTPTKPGGRSVHAYTLNYAPPEQLKGTGTDARSDLYSLGATLHHLLSGEMPENAKVREEVIRYGVPDPLRPIHEINESVPPVLTQAIVRSMQLDRQQRYQNAAEMRDALRQALQTVESTDSPAERPSKRLNASPSEEEVRRTQELAERQAKEESRGGEPKPEPQQPDTLIVPQTSPDARREKQEFDRKRKKEIERRKQLAQATRGQAVRTSPDFKPSAPPPFVEQTPASQLFPVADTQVTADAKSANRLRLILIAGAAALILISLGNLLWFNRGKNIGVQTSLPPSPTPSVEVPSVERLRYWFEIQGQPIPVTTPILALNQNIKLHFRTREKGYLYLLALNERNLLTPFLKGEPIKSDSEFVFPPNGWIQGVKPAEPMRLTLVWTAGLIERFDELALTLAQEKSSAERVEILKSPTRGELLKSLVGGVFPDKVEDLSERGTLAVSLGVKDEKKPLIFDVVLEAKRN